MWTLQDMISIVRLNVQEPGTKRFSDDNIAGLINDGVNFVGNLVAQYKPHLLHIKATTDLRSGINDYYIPMCAEDFLTAEILGSDSEYYHMSRVHESDAAVYEDEDFDQDTTSHYSVRGRGLHIHEGDLSAATSISNVTSGLRMTIRKRPSLLHYGTGQAGGDNTITLASSASAGLMLQTDDYYVGEWVYIVSGTGSSQLRRIIAYNHVTHIATVDRDWTTNPSDDSVYSMVSMIPFDMHQLFITYAEGQITRNQSASGEVTTKFLQMIGGTGPNGPVATHVKPWGQ